MTAIREWTKGLFTDPVDAEVTTVDKNGQFGKQSRFYVRLNNGTKAITNELEQQRYIAQCWGG